MDSRVSTWGFKTSFTLPLQLHKWKLCSGSCVQLGHRGFLFVAEQLCWETDLPNVVMFCISSQWRWSHSQRKFSSFKLVPRVCLLAAEVQSSVTATLAIKILLSILRKKSEQCFEEKSGNLLGGKSKNVQITLLFPRLLHRQTRCVQRKQTDRPPCDTASLLQECVKYSPSYSRVSFQPLCRQVNLGLCYFV